ncbi:MAG TPA: hypothetical protein VFL76_00955 [Edaphocola sp.]|nr:hypothetical protein [Edaphocola sp.]
MRTYICYIITGLITFWVVLFLFGVSAGFANYMPIMALIGSVLLFAAASPLLIIKKKLGLIIGIISCLLILPFDIGFTVSLFDDGVFNWGTLLALLPIISIIASSFYTIKEFRRPKRALSQKVRILLFCTPILLFILYIIFYGQYWSWAMFRL